MMLRFHSIQLSEADMISLIFDGRWIDDILSNNAFVNGFHSLV